MDTWIDAWEAVKLISKRQKTILFLRAYGFTWEEIQKGLEYETEEKTVRAYNRAVRAVLKICNEGNDASMLSDS